MKESIQTELKAVVKKLFNEQASFEVSRTEAQFGDYSTNAALILSKKLNKSPRDLAQLLTDELQSGNDNYEVSIAGPGFINFRLSNRALISQLEYRPLQVYFNQSVVAEYSDPNPFKVLHAGHLYTTLVGDSISRLIEAAGGQVHRVNFGGDVGRHVGITMWAVLRELDGEHPDKLQEIPAEKRLDWLSQQYVSGTQAFENDEMAKAEITKLNKKVYSLHADGDRTSEFAQIYWTCRKWSYEGFEALYERLQVKPFEKYYPESITVDAGMELVKKGRAKDVFDESDGAVVFKGEKFGLHTRVFITAEGLPTYETKDLGLAINKWNDFQFDKNVIITGNDIADYMKVILAALKNFNEKAAERTTHLTHGQIKLAGGVKMSSRMGNILRADDVLKSAEAAQNTAFGSKNYDVVLAAVKYAFLKQRIGGGDIMYDPVESISVNGDSGPYLQYAYARACSILAKAGEAGDIKMENVDSSERPLVAKLGQFSEVVDKAVEELSPHVICLYLYQLAVSFNRFYENSRIIGHDRQSQRVWLMKNYANTLKQGLELLGVPTPERL